MIFTKKRTDTYDDMSGEPVVDLAPGVWGNDENTATGKTRVQSTLRSVRGAGRKMFRPRLHELELATQEVAGPITFTRGGMYCWFILDGEPWDFRRTSDRRVRWDKQVYRWAALRGRTVRLRVTTRPFPAYERAQALDDATISPLLGLDGPPDALRWNQYLEFMQRRLRTTGLDEKMVAMGVWIGNNPKSPRTLDELVEGTNAPSLETTKILNEVAKVQKAVHGDGLNGRPVRPHEMAFLYHRSLSMGVPSPVRAGRLAGGRWTPDELAAFNQRSVWQYRPFGSTVQVLAEHNGETVERHVAVLTMGLMPEMEWPENGRDPWMLASDKLAFPVEWSLSGSILAQKDIVKMIEGEKNRSEAIRKHYEEHEMAPPPGVDRAIYAATKNLDEVTEGDARTGARFFGPIRLATYAATENQAIEQARELVDFYGEQYNIELHHPMGQAPLLREFIPGEPWDTKGFQRRMPVRYLAAATPHVDAKVGTDTGHYFGYGRGSRRRAVLWNGHWGPEHDRPGLYPLVAEPGGGKSVLIGLLAYNAVMAGQPSIIMDPSGPLARLCEVPELKKVSRNLDLTGEAPGTLAPYQLIPDPSREAFVDDNGELDEREYQFAVRRARGERQQLMFDVLRMWLPTSLLTRKGADVVLRDAIRRAQTWAHEQGYADVQINPRWVLRELQAAAQSHGGNGDRRELASDIAEEVREAAEFPLGELIMPAHEEPLEAAQADDKMLVVITMPGLNPPPEGVEKENWGSEERFTQPLLHLAAFFASRFVYSRDPNIRKNVFLDENHLMSRWGSGRAFFIRLSRDSRKKNTAVYAASQHPDDHLGIAKLDALIGGAFVGRLTDADTARSACRLLRCPEEYAGVIMGLSPQPRVDERQQAGGADEQIVKEVQHEPSSGEFVVLDPEGRIGKVRADWDWLPHLRDFLVTTPGRKRVEPTAEEAPTPFIDPELYETIVADPIRTVPLPEDEEQAA